MTEQDFQRKLTELIDQIDELPAEHRDSLRTLAEQTRDRHDKIRKTLSGLQESVDHLRLGVKYLVFDLEATRRENAHLRKLLERGSRGPRAAGDGGPDFA